MARILLVEDDVALAEALTLALKALGHDVVAALTGERALEALFTDRLELDFVLLDVMLPGMDGFEVCRRIRARSRLPVVLLTARGDPIDIVAGLECGADDYVVKPAEPRVIDARIKAIGRRAVTAPGPSAGRLRVGRLEIDAAAMSVTRDGAELALTATEIRLLVEFAEHPNQVLSRQTLLKRVWDYGYVGDSRIVDAAVARLRAKIEDDPANPVVLKTVRGLGYRLVGE
ncbi:DNA-binding response regulator, OmpR family, contains REC and winged-helix (wHTH) domain [Amycolatopsis lurida]|uniref:Transcriptional regulator n=1 Tax=Amycolatopsis lurida NRRL 2430 TaxID=1460371 RepID=A0A2P2FS81_AMYLU|nr:response regulator transcription factor [Amycolatopsis lurida]KFU79585.1 transcriptional regulator [Amycolatopsis lurida NRRL 2430]SEC99277.1 DNA-binding response regulator, OmpR family, contains REC and winged-helix (wHTH) domain [Amycolatopsis lurida]